MLSRRNFILSLAAVPVAGVFLPTLNVGRRITATEVLQEQAAFEVRVNGVLQKLNDDYTVSGDIISLAHPTGGEATISIKSQKKISRFVSDGFIRHVSL